MATKKIAEIIDEISDLEELIRLLKIMCTCCDRKRDNAVQLFQGTNITDILNTFAKSADYLQDLTCLYKEKLNAVEVTI